MVLAPCRFNPSQRPTNMSQTRLLDIACMQIHVKDHLVLIWHGTCIAGVSSPGSFLGGELSRAGRLSWKETRCRILRCCQVPPGCFCGKSLGITVLDLAIFSNFVSFMFWHLRIFGDESAEFWVNSSGLHGYSGCRHGGDPRAQYFFLTFGTDMNRQCTVTNIGDNQTRSFSLNTWVNQICEQHRCVCVCVALEVSNAFAPKEVPRQILIFLQAKNTFLLKQPVVAWQGWTGKGRTRGRGGPGWTSAGSISPPMVWAVGISSFVPTWLHFCCDISWTTMKSWIWGRILLGKPFFFEWVNSCRMILVQSLTWDACRSHGFSHLPELLKGSFGMGCSTSQ